MTAENIREVTARYRETFAVLKLTPVRQPADVEPGPTMVQALEHCYAMLAEIDRFAREGRMDKAFRWLGFVQGCLWACGIYTVQELKEHNSP
ncbi:MAG TPA: hypothetical protein VMU12_02375 [Candidatus Paceibacterota bacterium]|nr:hypothetical protein [Candidatus Paceibacterota bacterium]